MQFCILTNDLIVHEYFTTNRTIVLYLFPIKKKVSRINFMDCISNFYGI